ncbi:MAG: UDP-N-acetyl-D-mannosamine dehydrogenase [Bacteroidota bacterium]|jgi:UDP-N-acetyl-D-mannosaminuronic acid dehydrogenase
MSKNSGTTVTILGLGYIGLPTAALMAGKGLRVFGVDVNRKVVDTINKGRIHIVEPALEGLVHSVVRKGRLTASGKVVPTDVYMVAVPTPFKSGHRPDLTFVEKATRMVIPQLKEGTLFIIESTSPVGTTEKMAKLIYRQRPELKGKIHIAYCPERVLPGNVLHELQQNDRVIGGIDESSVAAASRFYGLFVRGKLHGTNARTAEMTKLVENAYRDVNIAFANQLSVICDKAGINVHELIALASRHPRVNILKPGPGVGGHCIAVDPWFIVSAFPKNAGLIREAREVNLAKTSWVIEKITKAAATFKKKVGRSPVIACMGLAYKPDIDDLRESPALEVFRHLIKKGMKVLPVEPNISATRSLRVFDTAAALDKADIIVFLVRHKEFVNLPIKGKTVLDFCGASGF